jgi:hypothetical protein
VIRTAIDQIRNALVDYRAELVYLIRTALIDLMRIAIVGLTAVFY